MISVGIVSGGPECTYLLERLKRFGTYIASHRIKGVPEVNIVFHLPGSLAKPGYVGLRTGKFSTEEETIMIQVGVEEDWIRLRDNNAVLEYIHDCSDEALGLAKSALEKQGIQYDLSRDRGLLEAWKKAEAF